MVKKWAFDEVGLSEIHAQRLADQEIDGKALLKMTEEKLERYGFPGGPATNLFEAIQHLKQGFHFSFQVFLPSPFSTILHVTHTYSSWPDFLAKANSQHSQNHYT